MDSWHNWRKRAKDWKKDHELTDADIAAQLSEKRSTVNSWLNKRDLNLADFMALCAAMGADPGHILFEVPVLRKSVKESSEAQQVLKSSPSAHPGHSDLMKKMRAFKKHKTRLRRRVPA